jgi:hypothetical protein
MRKLTRVIPYNVEKRSPTEIRLFNLQKKYLKKRDQKIWAEMFNICINYAHSIILQQNKKQQIYNPPNVIYDQAVASALYFLRQYINHEDFEVTGSFYGMLRYKVLEATKKKDREDGHESLNDEGKWNDNSNSNISMELGDLQLVKHIETFMSPIEKLGNPEVFLEKIDISELTENILKEADSELQKTHDIYTPLIIRLYLVLYFRRPKNKHSKKMFIKQWAQADDNKIERIIDLVILELHQRLKELQYN